MDYCAYQIKCDQNDGATGSTLITSALEDLEIDFVKGLGNWTYHSIRIEIVVFIISSKKRKILKFISQWGNKNVKCVYNVTNKFRVASL